MKKPRKRRIAKLERQLEKYESWKEHVEAVGGSLRRDENGKYYGVMYVD